MANSRTRWAAGTFAPWWLGLALAMSMTADAGQDAAAGASISPLSARAPLPPDLLVPPRSSAANGDFGRLTGEARRILRNASLVLGDGEEFTRLADEIEPRAVRKRGAGSFPTIDRSRKGEPSVGSRPTFDTLLRRRGGFAAFRMREAIFAHDEGSPVGSFAMQDGETEATEPSTAFEPWPEGESPTTVASRAATSPHRQGALTMTMRPAAINERLVQGATPILHRAEVLGSATPVRADQTPVEVIVLAALPPEQAPGKQLDLPKRMRPKDSVPLDQDRSALDRSAQERRCLAEAIYFEARGESEEGQAAVAQVVLNRVSSGLYPATICGVVYQNRHRTNACQFSFACEGKSLRVSESNAWKAASRIAAEVTNGRIYVSDVGASTHYHADFVRPRWAGRLEKMDVIGHHIFYKLRPGQI